MNKAHLAAILVNTILCQSVYSAEIDSVTTRGLQLDNSIELINKIVNQRLQEGVRNANNRQVFDVNLDDFEVIEGIVLSEACDVETLYAEIRKSLFQSYTASWGLKGFDLDRQLRKLLAKHSYSLSLNDSIYRDIGYLEGFSLKLKELSDVVNINGHLVGLDKIGHFFAEGWEYFERTNDAGYEFEQALDWGRRQEAGKFGYRTTGIFSFADLAANLNGWRFWNRVLHKHNDPLKSVFANWLTSAYVSCDIQYIESIKKRTIVRAWEVNMRFDLSDYVDGAWDEANNCNSYADPIIEAKVAARIRIVAPGYTCPDRPVHCIEARKKYREFAKYVLHPYCMRAGSN